MKHGWGGQADHFRSAHARNDRGRIFGTEQANFSLCAAVSVNRSLRCRDVDSAGKGIGKITPSGEITELTVEGLKTDVYLRGITAGPDGNIWFTFYESSFFGGRGIVRITPSGVATVFSSGIDQYSKLGSIAAGPDGNLWFTLTNATGP